MRISMFLVVCFALLLSQSLNAQGWGRSATATGTIMGVTDSEYDQGWNVGYIAINGTAWLNLIVYLNPYSTGRVAGSAHITVTYPFQGGQHTLNQDLVQKGIGEGEFYVYPNEYLGSGQTHAYINHYIVHAEAQKLAEGSPNPYAFAAVDLYW